MKTTIFKLSALALLAQLSCHSIASPAATGLDRHGFDARVRAQDDLYRAVNGQWIKATAIPGDRSVIGTFTDLSDRADARLRSIVEGLAAKPQRPGSKEAQIGAFYSAYLDLAAIERAGLAPMQPLLAEIDAIQSSAELAQWQGSMQGRVLTPLQLDVLPDFKQPGINRALLRQSGLGLPSRDYYLKADDARMARARAAYIAYLTLLAGQLGEPAPAEAAQRVLALEQRIAALHWDEVESRDSVKIYNPHTPAQLQALAPAYDWQGLLAAAQLRQVDKLVVWQPSAAIGIAKLLAEEPLADWKLYQKLHSLDAHAAVLPKAIREARFAFRGTALTGASEERPRWQQGINAVNEALGEALGQLYVAKHFPAAHKARMQALVANLMAAFGESIDTLDWMSAETKAQAKIKLSKYSVKIGYPDAWRDYAALQLRAGDALGNRERAAAFEWARIAAKLGRPVDRGEWGMFPQQVNAYYEPTTNEIVFPAAILQPPFFDMKADDAVNYGAIGAIIGHEISHGFDDDGSQFDGDGMLRNWWTETDRKAFEAVGAKLVKQYAGYEAIPGKQVNGQLTLGENIADLSGLQVAYKAYQRSLKGRPAPVLGGLTGEQRFFMGWSQGWREKMREERCLQLLTADPHAPAEFRANGAPVNIDAFHQAFGTKPGDKLYKPSAERIRIW